MMMCKIAVLAACFSATAASCFRTVLNATVLGELEVIGRRIGKGAMAEVYRVKYGGYKYALRCVFPRDIGQQGTESYISKEAVTEDAENTMRLIDTINDIPGIVTYYGNGIGPTKNIPEGIRIPKGCKKGYFFLMELCSGSLSSRYERLSDKQRIAAAHDISLTLAKLHSRHIYHKDLKLDNIFVTHKNELRLADFGTPEGRIDWKKNDLKDLWKLVLLDLVPTEYLKRRGKPIYLKQAIAGVIRNDGGVIPTASSFAKAFEYIYKNTDVHLDEFQELLRGRGGQSMCSKVLSTLLTPVTGPYRYCVGPFLYSSAPKNRRRLKNVSVSPLMRHLLDELATMG